MEETSDAAIEKSGEAENEEKEAKTNDFPLVGFFPFGPIAQKQWQIELRTFFRFFDEMAAKIIAKDPPYQIMRSAPLWNLLTAHRSGQRVAKKCQKLEESLILYMPDRLKTIWPSKQIEKRETTHCVWNSLKKSHWTLRAKRATFTFWVDKNTKINHSNATFWVIFKHCAFAYCIIEYQIHLL